MTDFHTHTSTGIRGSGRTYRALQEAPDGAIFIVASHREIDRCRGELVKMGRRSNALRFVSARDRITPERLRGIRRSMVHTDHDWARNLLTGNPTGADAAQYDAIVHALQMLHD